jgi:hypothetical protein
VCAITDWVCLIVTVAASLNKNLSNKITHQMSRISVVALCFEYSMTDILNRIEVDNRSLYHWQNLSAQQIAACV